MASVSGSTVDLMGTVKKPTGDSLIRWPASLVEHRGKRPHVRSDLICCRVRRLWTGTSIRGRQLAC